MGIKSVSGTEIRVLSSDVADKIAAGEVAERPSAVVKELVENAIDAGADKITVEIKNGGVKMIRVADNGKGIPADQVETAFLRHATSKLRDADDLFRISTMGFRGEALASICAVARVDIITKTKDVETGVHYTVDHGVSGVADEIACADGTVMVVEDLFANVPARMKFLKRDRTEAGYVSDLMTRLALSEPDIAFDYISDGKQIFNTSGDGDMVNVILKVYGLNFAKAVIPVDYSEDGVHIGGAIGKPELTFGNRTKQTIFVNGRYIKNHVVSKVAEEAYRNSIMVGKFPFFVLEIDLAPELVDVNVHPAKTEVKFANEKALYDIVYHAVKNTLYGMTATMPKTESKEEHRNPQLPQQHGDQEPNGGKTDFRSRQGGYNSYSVSAPDYRYDRISDQSVGLTPKMVNDYLSYTTPKTAKMMISDNEEEEKTEVLQVGESAGEKYASEPVQMTFKGDNEAETEAETETEAEALSVSGDVAFSDYRIVGQVFDTYVLIVEKDCLYMIDQHAAHERFRFENLKKSYTEGEKMAQALLTPIVVNLTHIEYDAVMSNIKELAEFGFAIEEFGPNTVLVNETPIIAPDDVIRDLLLELADAYADNIRHPIADFEEKALDMISCKYAIKANDKLSLEEMTETVRQVSQLYSRGIRTCPHGRPIAVRLTKREIEKMFKRIV